MVPGERKGEVTSVVGVGVGALERGEGRGERTGREKGVEEVRNPAVRAGGAPREGSAGAKEEGRGSW